MNPEQNTEHLTVDMRLTTLFSLFFSVDYSHITWE